MLAGMVRRTLWILFLILATLTVGAGVAGFLITLPGERITPSGLKRNQALYVTMRDGTRIAVDLWLPESYRDGRIPTILRATRYGRARKVTVLGRLLWKLGVLKDAGLNRNFGPTMGVPEFNRRGYAAVVVDGRGSGASFGSRRAECAPEEIADYGEVIDWIVRQPWSDGTVGAWGISQDALNIELVASLGKPELKAIATLYTTMDSQFTTAGFGGIYNRENVKKWADRNKVVDANKPACPPDNFRCRFTNTVIFAGAKPVDDPRGSELLAEAVAARDNYDVLESWGTLLYRGDPLGKSDLTMADIMPYGVRSRIEASGVPIFSIYGWLDAGLAFSGLAHYNHFNNPQVVLIGPFSHGGLFDADPYRPADTPAKPDHDEQLRMVTDFFDDFVKGESPSKPERMVRYFTFGADTWRDTSVWPPAGLEPVAFFLEEGATARVSPAGSGADTMNVDFSTGSGNLSRYRSIVEATDIVYPQRSADTAKLLHYDSDPMTTDVELTGSPVAKLFVSTTREDGAFYVYIDDVAPDGSVTYLTEGVLRGLFHKTSSRPGPYETFGVDRAYWKEDAEPMEPGKVYPLDIEMFPVSALVRKGHRLRFSLSGADADAMPRIPAEGPAPQVTFHRTESARSMILVPMAPFPGSARGSEDSP